MNYSLRHIIIYFVIIINLLTGLTAVYRLFYKADLPFKYYSTDEHVISAETYANIKSGSRIAEIDGMNVTSEYEVEFILDSRQIGDEVSLKVYNDDKSASETVKLSDYYKKYTFIIVSLIIGLTFWITGIYVYSVRKDDHSAVILCLVLTTFSLATFSTACYFGRGNDWIGYLIKLSHSLSYIMGSVFFLHFTLVFPLPLFRKQNLFIYSLYISAVIMSIIVTSELFSAMKYLNESSIDLFTLYWLYVQLTLLISLLSGTAILIIKYKNLESKSEKRKLEWIFWGISAGAGPFIIFWLIPGIFGLPYLINEEIILALLIVIPVSFTIALVKYHIFNIEIVVKRSVVYFLLIFLTILLYFGIIYSLSLFAYNFAGEQSKMFNLTAALFIALIFNPLRLRLKKFVDSVFYREKYFFDKAITDLTEKTKNCISLESIGEILIQEINIFIPAKSIAVCIIDESRERLKVLTQINFDKFSGNIGALRIRNLFQNFIFPLAVKEKIDKELMCDLSLENVLKRWKINVAIPLTPGLGDITGVIILGDKMSGLRYSVSDIDLLNAIAFEASLGIKRFQLQNRLISEEAENIRLKELNELKSYFVSSVSHDLKTPISGIKIFTELLKKENISRDKSEEYISMIEGETDRLGRMIENILNYNKIEKGIINYSYKKVNLNNILISVMNNMQYEFIMHRFEVVKQLSENPLYIKADPDALNSLFENLISNSVKYSGQKRYIKISTALVENAAEVVIEDRGTGISEINIKHIFDPYYREKGPGSYKVKGTGLGLTIVKNISDSHFGVIEVKSKTGCGTVFKIKFPLYKNEEYNIIN